MKISQTAGNHNITSMPGIKDEVSPQELPTTLVANSILNPVDVEKRACLEKEKDLLKRVSQLQEGERREGGDAGAGCFIGVALLCVMGICLELRGS